MNNYILPLFIALFFNILTYNALPTFEINGVKHTETRCDQEDGYFRFQLLGEGTGITEEVRITFPLKEPKDCYAVCYAKPTSMNCTMDSLIYDLSGAKILEVFPEEPTLEELQFVGWDKYFISENRVLNSATNCNPPANRKIDPKKEDEEIILAAYDAKNIEIFGCFRKKNNFGFQLSKMKDEKSELDSIDHDIYFEIKFKQPSNKSAFCVITKSEDKAKYKVRCSIDYGGEIEVGGEASGTVKLNNKKIKIVLRGLLIPPTVVDECTKEKNNF
jgi:hypothetical protein